MLNRDQWAALLRESYKLLGEMLAARKCKLADTEGNRFRVVEALQKSFNGVEPENPKAQDLAARMFSFVLSDSNALVSGRGGGQLLWEIEPLLIQKYKDQKRGASDRTTQLPDKQKRHVSESPETRRSNIKSMECEYDALGPVSPRSAAVRDFINSIREDEKSDTTTALVYLKNVLTLSADYTAVGRQLKKYLQEAA